MRLPGHSNAGILLCAGRVRARLLTLEYIARSGILLAHLNFRYVNSHSKLQMAVANPVTRVSQS